MKTEFLHQWNRKNGVPLRTRLTAYLPRYAKWASWFAPIFNLGNSITLVTKLLGMSSKRRLPRFRRDSYKALPAKKAGREVVLLVDTFSRYFEPENARAARAVLEAGGYSVIEDHSARPLCCGRTFFSAGLVDQARAELLRVVEALGPYAERGVPIVGIEPSCLLTLRDELSVVLNGESVKAIEKQSMLLEEFLARESKAGTLRLPMRKEQAKQTAYVHGHCHQKAMGAFPDVVTALQLVPGLTVNTIESSCCGMAGSFGYEENHYDVSMKMAERSLLPAVRSAPPDALIVADGTSCRHQIHDGAGREAVHVARVLAAALEPQP